MQRDISNQLFEQAKKIFPGGVNSPVRAFKSVNGSPLFIEKGEGAYIWDADGNKFIDFCCSWGPLILGHKHPTVMHHINQALNNGTTFGTPTKWGLQLGELIVNNNKYIDMLRFVSSGTEAVMSAIRLARGFTGRNKIIKFEGCYHGHVDHLLVKAGSGLATLGTSSSAGVPEAFANQTIVLPLNDVEVLTATLEKHATDIACIIIEPIPANNGLLLQDKSFLQLLRDECTKHNIVLLFDEVISGFRAGFEGAAAHYNITPDLITYGKIIGGGMPVGAFGGKAEIMKHVAPLGNVYQAGTLSANPVAMAAGLGQLKECLKPNFYKNLEENTQTFVNQINKYCEQKQYPVKLFSVASIFWIAFTQKQKVQSADEIDGSKMTYFAQLHAYLLENGVYLGPSGYEVGFVSTAHSNTILNEAVQKFCKGFDYIF